MGGDAALSAIHRFSSFFITFFIVPAGDFGFTG
jgi:hypothetical protein